MGAFRLVRSRASRLMQQLPDCTIAEHRPHITVTGHPHERCEMLNNIGTERHFIPAAVQNEGSWRPLCLAAPIPCQRGIARHGEVHLFATDDDLRTGHTEDSQGLAIPESVAFMPAMSPQQDNERSALRSLSPSFLDCWLVGPLESQCGLVVGRQIKAVVRRVRSHEEACDLLFSMNTWATNSFGAALRAVLSWTTRYFSHCVTKDVLDVSATQLSLQLHNVVHDCKEE